MIYLRLSIALLAYSMIAWAMMVVLLLNGRL